MLAVGAVGSPLSRSKSRPRTSFLLLLALASSFVFVFSLFPPFFYFFFFATGEEEEREEGGRGRLVPIMAGEGSGEASTGEETIGSDGLRVVVSTGEGR